MATKTVAWNSGSGVITLTYTGQGNGSVSVKSDANDSFDARSQNLNIVTTDGSPKKAVQVLVKQAGKPLGWTTKDFGYTGSVQEVTLPKGRYKLQCWGAQGGTSYGSGNGVGSKGGYSEGVLTLAQTTTLYIYVGGKGSRGSSNSLVNGGWNGGGASVGHSSYISGGAEGDSYPACGGGGTDICTILSEMNYTNGVTNRDAASLLSRCIVAGGGAGGSYAYYKQEYYEEYWQDFYSDGGGCVKEADDRYYVDSKYYVVGEDVNIGDTLRFTNISDDSYYTETFPIRWTYKNSAGGYPNVYGDEITITSDMEWVVVRIRYYSDVGYVTFDVQIKEQTSNETINEQTSSANQVGGGVNGGGNYGGKQSSAGNGGSFGVGASQTTTNYMHCSGAGGGGWYGGGRGYSDNNVGAVNDSGGGSGFVNTAANASYRPSGYTGLQLDSGSTTAGNSSHPSVNGGTEVGHSGNGYARITVL